MPKAIIYTLIVPEFIQAKNIAPPFREKLSYKIVPLTAKCTAVFLLFYSWALASPNIGARPLTSTPKFPQYTYTKICT